MYFLSLLFSYMRLTIFVLRTSHIVDLAVLSIVKCIKARNKRLADTGGKWIDGLPKVISKKGANRNTKIRLILAAEFLMLINQFNLFI